MERSKYIDDRLRNYERYGGYQMELTYPILTEQTTNLEERLSRVRFWRTILNCKIDKK